jgi:hypothetical protein
VPFYRFEIELAQETTVTTDMELGYSKFDQALLWVGVYIALAVVADLMLRNILATFTSYAFMFDIQTNQQIVMVRDSKIEQSFSPNLNREQSVEIDAGSLSLNWPLRNFNIAADPVVDQESPLPETNSNSPRKPQVPKNRNSV